jgi:hypothetical protein
MKAIKYQVHAEWFERVPGKPLAVRKETTIVIPAFDFMEAMRLSEKRFPNAVSRSIKNMTPKKDGLE